VILQEIGWVTLLYLILKLINKAGKSTHRATWSIRKEISSVKLAIRLFSKRKSYRKMESFLLIILWNGTISTHRIFLIKGNLEQMNTAMSLIVSPMLSR